VVTVTALAGLAGGLLIAGLAMLVLELVRRAPEPGLPRMRMSFRLDRRFRNRLLIAACCGIAALALTRWPVAMIAAVLAVLFLPRVTSSRPARQRAAMLEGLEQWTRRLSDMLTASRGLEDALETSARQAPAAVAQAVSALSRRLAARTDTEAALRAFADDLNDPAGDRIAAALIIATGRRGGAARDVLNALAVMLARDVAMRREIEAERVQHRTTVKWLTFFVVGFTAFAAANRSYSAPYGTVPGQVVMALVVALYAGGLAWLQHLGAIPVPGRFLGSENAPARSTV
jgi:Flp pilus assembly protein TadB